MLLRVASGSGENSVGLGPEVSPELIISQLMGQLATLMVGVMSLDCKGTLAQNIIMNFYYFLLLMR
jgi:hypothetical protein